MFKKLNHSPGFINRIKSSEMKGVSYSNEIDNNCFVCVEKLLKKATKK